MIAARPIIDRPHPTTPDSEQPLNASSNRYEFDSQSDVARRTSVALASRGLVISEGAVDLRRTVEIVLVDGRRLVVVPLHSLDYVDGEPATSTALEWAFTVRDRGGALLESPDVVDEDDDGPFGCPTTWEIAAPSFDIAAGVLVTEKVLASFGLGPLRGAAPGESAPTYTEAPYPGARPEGSWVVDPDERLYPVVPDSSSLSGWAVVTGESEAQCLDAWLAEHDAPALLERIALLSYGSNGCPQKFVSNKVTLPGVNLAVETHGLAAAHCAGTRGGDGAVPATLVAAPEMVERHVVSYVSVADLDALDRVEGRTGRWYDLVALDAGRVVRADGVVLEDVRGYVGSKSVRWPLADEQGRPLLLTDVSQADALALVSSGRFRSIEPEPIGAVIPAGRP